MRPYEQQIREAIERLLSGAPEHTDGRLTVTNLAREAQIKRRTTLNDTYGDLVEDFLGRREQSARDPDHGRRSAQMLRLRARLAQSEAHNGLLAQANQALAEENRRMREQLERLGRIHVIEGGRA